MERKTLQLKYGLGIIHTVPWLEIAQGDVALHPVEPAIAALIKNVIDVVVEDEYTLPSESGTYNITVPVGKTVSIIERSENTEQVAKQVHVTLEENSTATYKVQTNAGTSVALRTMTCEKGSMPHIQESAVNTTDLISHTHVVLAGEGATVEFASAFYGANNAVIDTSQTVRHIVNNTSSNLITRGVLDGNTKGFYRATIDIAHGAVGCSGHQDEKTILLSDNARMMAVPALEIANQDVSASHAVATTRLKPEDLFYVQSRGMSESEARNTMIRAHLSPVLGACAEEVLGQIKK